jgi:hypothetical protein
VKGELSGKHKRSIDLAIRRIESAANDIANHHHPYECAINAGYGKIVASN